MLLTNLDKELGVMLSEHRATSDAARLHRTIGLRRGRGRYTRRLRGNNTMELIGEKL